MAFLVAPACSAAVVRAEATEMDANDLCRWALADDEAAEAHVSAAAEVAADDAALSVEAGA